MISYGGLDVKGVKNLTRDSPIRDILPSAVIYSGTRKGSCLHQICDFSLEKAHRIRHRKGRTVTYLGRKAYAHTGVSQSVLPIVACGNSPHNSGHGNWLMAGDFCSS